MFARAGIDKATAEAAVAERQIHELPCARGCTYYVPERDYALALKVGQGTSEVASMNTARKHLGFTDSDLQTLTGHVIAALDSGPMTPRQMREVLGDKIRNFGDEGKKRGQTTSLSLALGHLQARGQIRRIPANGRLDTESYAYEVWEPNPLHGCELSREDALKELARLYFSWIGPASAGHFQWFAGIGVGAAKEAMSGLSLVEVGDGLLLPAELQEAFDSHVVPKEPAYALVSCIDSAILLRRDAGSLIDDHASWGEFMSGRGLTDLDYNPILDRGRVVGFWEYDPEAQEIATRLFIEPNTELTQAIRKTESFIRDELGDARSFSLDSPKSRRPRIEKLRQM